MKTRISIICPAYNSAKYIGSTIQSILNQTFREFELIIILEPSSDNTINEIKKFKDKRIILLINKKRLGLSKSLNLGIKKSRSDFIARVDSDDLYLKNRLQEQYSYLVNNPKVDMIGTDTIVFNKKRKVQYYYPKSNNLIKWGMAFFCPFSHPTVMIKKKIFYKYGFYSSVRFEDYNLYIKLVNKIRFENIPKFLCYIRKHNQNISIIKSHLDRLKEIKMYIKFIYKTYNIHVKKNVANLMIYGKSKISSNQDIKDAIEVIKILRIKFLKKFPKETEIINIDVVFRIIFICLRNYSFINLVVNTFYFFKLDKLFFYHLFLKLLNKYLLNKHSMIGLNEKH